jgi:hypothetical protein
MSEAKNKINLSEARQNSPSGIVDKAKKIAEIAKNPVGLLSQVSIFNDIPYIVAFGMAILKDILDLAVIGALPGIGTVLTIIASITIFFMMLLSGSGSSKKMAGGMIKKGLVLAGGTIFEMVGFGLNFFPMETATVLLVYLMELADRKKAAAGNPEN